MDNKQLEAIAKDCTTLVEKALKAAKVDWLIERIDDDRHRIIIAVAAKQQGGPVQEYPPGRE